MRTDNVRAVLVTAPLLLTLVPALMLAQQASVSGQVTDHSSGRPVPEATVSVVGTDRRAITDAEGRYLLREIPPGRIQLRASRIGYQSQIQLLTVSPGQAVTVNFEIAAAVVSLDEVVVTAVGEQRQRELGNAVSKLTAAAVVEEAPIVAFSDVLTARAPSVVVQRSSGQVGSGTRIRIRGANSVSLTNEPLVYIDGVRVESSTNLISVVTGGQSPTRLDDINPEDIEAVEVIKGPSAATLYGTEAANGVIRITTKRGRAGRPRWNFYVEQGLAIDPAEYPANFTAFGRRPDGTVTSSCTLILVSLGSCVQDSIVSFNVLEDPATTPISTGHRAQYGANVSGGSDVLSYFISGELEKEVGTYELPDSIQDTLRAIRGELPDHMLRPNSVERINLRANLRAQVLDNADLTVSAGYTLSDLQIVQNDNNSLGILPSGLFGTHSRSVRGGWGFRLPEEIFAIDTRQSVERFTGSMNGDWQPFGFLSVRTAVGLDVTSQLDAQLFPTGEVPVGTLVDGTKTANRFQLFQYTVDLGASATARLGSRLRSKTSVGVQYFRDLATGVTATGNQLPAGASSVGAAAVTIAGETTTERITLGSFIEQQFTLNDRLFVTGAVRADDNSSFGRDFEAIIYPKLSFSWVVSEEPFFPQGNFLSSLRLRAAWGATGLQPVANAAIDFFLPVSVSDVAGADRIGVTLGGVGNVDLKPEKATEFEGGLDLDLWNGRTGIQVTYFRKKSTDALVSRVLAPSLGTGTGATGRFENLGSVLNRGWEGVLSARVVDSRAFQWDFTFTGSTLQNELLELGEGIEPIVFGIQRHAPGYPLGGFWQRPILEVNDANGDGVIALSEVVLGDTAVFLGGPLPGRELSIHSGITLFNRLRLQGLLDYRGGHVRDAGTSWFRCSQIQRCEAAFVPGTDFSEQAAAVVARSQLTRAGYVRSAAFWRLREASLSFFAPQSWASRIRASGITLTLTGRNLLTITDWPDLDPEAQSNQSANFGNIEFLTQPLVQHWIARLSVTF
ncbi:TonB-dependent receptor SusC [bacterium HR33]|nr:TonB-dependent receptor SusC [bacterium HR33]